VRLKAATQPPHHCGDTLSSTTSVCKKTASTAAVMSKQNAFQKSELGKVLSISIKKFFYCCFISYQAMGLGLL